MTNSKICILIFFILELATVARAGEPHKQLLLFEAKSVVEQNSEYEHSKLVDKGFRIYHAVQHIYIDKQIFRIVDTVLIFAAVNGVVREYRCMGPNNLMCTVRYVMQYKKKVLIFAAITVSNAVQQSTYYNRPVAVYYLTRYRL